ncbi:zinc ribbon domain-containing protein [Aquisalimonas sp. 2447]|uniref:FmdB family zinc ribbon protein n=1 Tax=Aquisalimonas sp. 2447 TaxID=2740807 RepID=UPI00143261AC|nr:zinc ribbon domain-containing protein [Aquisalimonas sp. 2447]QIT56591.1 zinc ribbon domain-containing protein [Aquisalimonas sp. 2447]
MPIYEYLCDNCGHEQEAIQKFSDDPLTDCEACHEPKLRRKISAAAFRLKGGGWYETDFKDGNRRNVIGDSSSANGSGSGEKTEKSGGEGKAASGEGGKKDTAKKESTPTKTAASDA